MPQVCAPRRLGVALNHDMTKTPAPVYMDLKKNDSRQYRAERRDVANAFLAETRINNDLDDRKWTGNGFPGKFQFVTRVGTDLLRPGVKMERDIQMSTLANDNSRQLNTTAMGRAQILFSSKPSAEEEMAHQRAMASMRSLRGHAEHHELAENPHAHRRNELELSMNRQTRISDIQQDMQGLRTAGQASINPRMGTNGSLPDLTRLRGRAGLELWRGSTPFALDPSLDAPAAWPPRPAFAHPN
eukprot:TRINITY_DN2433_c0_g2_i1.p1 TRINITY_DN2433_c0_g2~~TRINITY_DN2433_c0_g2_i1.p1  ORF type:complete len:243 (-),score=41.44 TRINITY_DN2433_c0_g2_i1:63-791(-)